MLPIPLHFSVIIALVLSLAAATTAMLNVLKFQQIMENFEESRYGFVARDIDHVLEQSVNLGLPLDQIDNAQEFIERQLQLDSDITTIAVFDLEDEVLYQTSRLPEGSSAVILRGGTGATGISDERFIAGPIVNSFGQPVGGVMVRYSGTPEARREDQVLRAMALATFSAALVGGIILWLGASRLLAPLRRRLAETTQALRQARGGGKESPVDASPFETLAGKALHDRRQVERDIDALDEGSAG